MTIKLIAIDIDGTLLNSERKLTDNVKNTLKKAVNQGIHVVLTTGRPTVGIQSLLKELDLSENDSYAITYNGGVVQNITSGEILVENGLNFQDYLDIELLSRKLGVHLHAQDDSIMYTANTDISPYTIHEATLTGIPLHYKPVYDMDSSIKIIKSMMVADEEILDSAIKSIPKHYYDKFSIVKSAPYYLEILDKTATKGNAVKELADHLNITPDEIMAIGDNENDLSMIEYAGMGIAMGNALDSVKIIATHTTKSNDEDGVAFAINEWALNI